jgi:hypothetical protein
MAWNDRTLRRREFALENMQVGAADGAGMNFDKDLIAGGFGLGNVGYAERSRFDRRGSGKDTGLHDFIVAGVGRDFAPFARDQVGKSADPARRSAGATLS